VFETIDAEGSVSVSDEFVMRDQFDRWGRVWHQSQCDLVHRSHPVDGHGLHVGGPPAGFTNSRYESVYKLCEGRPRMARPGRIRLPDASPDRGYVKSKGRLSSHSNHYLDSTAQS